MYGKPSSNHYLICFVIYNLFVPYFLVPDIEDIGSRSHGYGEHASRAEINIRDVQQALVDEVIDLTNNNNQRRTENHGRERLETIITP